MIMELIRNSQNDANKHNLTSSQSVNCVKNSKHISWNYKIPELTKISTKPYELNEDDMYEIKEENENENNVETGSQIQNDAIKSPSLQNKNSTVMSEIENFIFDQLVLSKAENNLKLSDWKQHNGLDMDFFENLQGKDQFFHHIIDFNHKEESKIDQKAIWDSDIQNIQSVQVFDFKFGELEDMGEIIDIDSMKI